MYIIKFIYATCTHRYALLFPIHNEPVIVKRLNGMKVKVSCDVVHYINRYVRDHCVVCTLLMLLLLVADVSLNAMNDVFT